MLVDHLQRPFGRLAGSMRPMRRRLHFSSIGRGDDHLCKLFSTSVHQDRRCSSLDVAGGSPGPPGAGFGVAACDPASSQAWEAPDHPPQLQRKAVCACATAAPVPLRCRLAFAPPPLRTAIACHAPPARYVLQGVELLAHGAGNKVERVKAEEALEGKTVGIYFSAHWCAGWVGWVGWVVSCSLPHSLAGTPSARLRSFARRCCYRVWYCR